ncbi:MAG: hypothetical protein AB9880_04275 [Christensenellales bacterium]
MLRKGFFTAAILLMAVLGMLQTAQADVMVEVRQERKGASFVEVPVLSGLDNQFVQDSINRGINTLGSYEGYLATLRGLSDDNPGDLQVRASARLLQTAEGPGLLSILVEASGRIGPGRPGYQAQPLVFDLASGLQLTASDVFLDVPAAGLALDQLVEEEVAPDFSSYADAEGLLPVPLDSFMLDEAGITFHYPSKQLMLLSGRNGAVNFHYDEIAGLLNLLEGSALNRIGLQATLETGAGTRTTAERFAGEGRLPGIPIALGDVTPDVLERYPLLVDSEGFPGGTLYLLEDARLRGTSLIVSRDDERVISGIISRRMNLGGLICGQADRSMVTSQLGAPGSTGSLDEAVAEAIGLLGSSLDSYPLGDKVLSFIYDGDGVLQAIWLRSQGN